MSQNVTMFPVEVNILNPEHLLKPGMNTEVEIHIGQRQGALAIPNAALRTPRDVASAAQVLGLDPHAVEQQLAQAQPADSPPPPATGDRAAMGDGSKLHAAEPKSGGATFTTPSGRTITLPPGVTPEQVRAAFAKRMSGQALTPAEQALLAQVRSQFQQAAGAPSAPARGAGSGSYIVFTLRGGKIAPVHIRTGLTDLDYIEVTSGLTERDTVLVLSSTSPS